MVTNVLQLFFDLHKVGKKKVLIKELVDEESTIIKQEDVPNFTPDYTKLSQNQTTTQLPRWIAGPQSPARF